MRDRPPVHASSWLSRAAAVGLAGAIVTLALLQLRGWDGRVNADGVSYLDLARQYAHGDLTAVANGYWSPLYPMLLGMVQRVARMVSPGVAAIRVALAVNVAIFALAGLAVVRLQRLLAEQPVPGDGAVRAARAAVAGALCIWCLLRMIGVTAVTPDALLAIWLVLASAEIAAAPSPARSGRSHLRFGALLGLGYWTKAVFFPVAFAALVAYVLATPAVCRRRAVTRALLPFFLICAPLIAVQSWTQGRPSFGETGRLNYRWYVGREPHVRDVHEPEAETAARARRGQASLVALESVRGAVLYTGGTAGSFPYWYDASRYEPREGSGFSLEAQREVLALNAEWFRLTGGAFFIVALAGATLARFRGAVRPLRLLVALPAVTMLGLYALTHPEGRLGAAAIVCALLVMVNLADAGPRGWRAPLIGGECVALAVIVILSIGRTAKRIPTEPVAIVPTPSAARLRDAGVPRGATVALVGSPYGQFWAHEAEVRIVALVPAGDSLHPVSDADLRAVMAESARRGTPVSAVVWNGPVVRSAAAVPLAPGWWALPGR